MPCHPKVLGLLVKEMKVINSINRGSQPLGIPAMTNGVEGAFFHPLTLS